MSLNNVMLYLIKGNKLTEPQLKKSFSYKYGQLKEIESQVIIFPIDSGKAIDFRFKSLEIKKWGDIKNTRIGRILPPQIDRIQQRYAHYLIRYGLSRIPESAIK